MNEHEQTLHDVREAINRLPVNERAEVLRVTGIFRQHIFATGTPALMALALIGAEMACHDGTAIDVPQTPNPKPLTPQQEQEKGGV